MRRLTLCALMFAIVACGGDATDDGSGGEDDHAEHAGKHGGQLLVLVEHELFMEVAHDEEAGRVEVWFHRGEEMAETSPDGPPVLNFVVDGSATQLTANQDASSYWFADEALKGEPENARFTVTIDGKRYVPAWEHEHE